MTQLVKTINVRKVSRLLPVVSDLPLKLNTVLRKEK